MDTLVENRDGRFDVKKGRFAGKTNYAARLVAVCRVGTAMSYTPEAGRLVVSTWLSELLW